MKTWITRVLFVLGFVVGFIPIVSADDIDTETSKGDQQILRLALLHLGIQAPELGIHSPGKEFRLSQVVRDDMNQIHVRLDQVRHGVPVFGQQLIVHIKRARAGPVDSPERPRSGASAIGAKEDDAAFKSRSFPSDIERIVRDTLNKLSEAFTHNAGSELAFLVTGAIYVNFAAPTHPRISAGDARKIALNEFPGPVTGIPVVELVLLPLNERTVRVHEKVLLREGDVVLAYRVALDDEATPRRVIAFVDAITGRLVDSYDDLQTATGTGQSLYSGTVQITTELTPVGYILFDRTRGGSYGLQTNDLQDGPPVFDPSNPLLDGSVSIFDTDNMWGNGTITDRVSAAVDAHFGAQMTWDYYRSVHGRNGIFNDGKGTRSRVHQGPNYSNARWGSTCRCMTYGDGDGVTFSPLVSLDTAGHEMTHGVTQATAGLFYRNQSGGLNEAISDIFGTAVEFFAAESRATTKIPNYLILEDAWTPGVPGDAFRHMDNPTADGLSIDTLQNYINGMDVHYSSGIGNNAFYLLAEGGTHRLGRTVIGIGRRNAEKIFYRALTAYMIPSESFCMARNHTLLAAQDLFGTSSPQTLSVQQAWSAVTVAACIVDGAEEPPPGTAGPP